MQKHIQWVWRIFSDNLRWIWRFTSSGQCLGWIYDHFVRLAFVKQRWFRVERSTDLLISFTVRKCCLWYGTCSLLARICLETPRNLRSARTLISGNTNLQNSLSGTESLWVESAERVSESSWCLEWSNDIIERWCTAWTRFVMHLATNCGWFQNRLVEEILKFDPDFTWKQISEFSKISRYPQVVMLLKFLKDMSRDTQIRIKTYEQAITSHKSHLTCFTL